MVPTWTALQHRGSGAAVDADTLAIGDEAVASGVPPGAAAARPLRAQGRRRWRRLLLVEGGRDRELSRIVDATPPPSPRRRSRTTRTRVAVHQISPMAQSRTWAPPNRARVSIDGSNESDPPQGSPDNEQQAEAANNRGDRPTADGEPSRDGLGAHDHGIPGQANQYRQAKWRSRAPRSHSLRPACRSPRSWPATWRGRDRWTPPG